MPVPVQECIELCLGCHRVCLETVAYLAAGGQPAEVSHIRLLFNCAEICQTSASLLRGAADLTGRTCVACAEVCERCARYCDGFGADLQLRACADACRRCAAACRRQAALAA
ncbi:MAG TPA: four-helix bundle copper-binding protein [Methylomirabilota bacterium]|jgi:hypothetical protein|nr:four-helix bundle copper-binding protein [Methylomirabilota bacterium]